MVYFLTRKTPSGVVLVAGLVVEALALQRSVLGVVPFVRRFGVGSTGPLFLSPPPRKCVPTPSAIILTPSAKRRHSSRQESWYDSEARTCGDKFLYPHPTRWSPHATESRWRTRRRSDKGVHPDWSHQKQTHRPPYTSAAAFLADLRDFCRAGAESGTALGSGWTAFALRDWLAAFTGLGSGVFTPRARQRRRRNKIFIFMSSYSAPARYDTQPGRTVSARLLPKP